MPCRHGLDTHSPSVSLAGTRAACHMHTSTWCTLAFVLCLSHLASGVSPLPLFFFLLFPLCHPAELSVSSQSLVLKRASHPGDHVISKKPFGHLASFLHCLGVERGYKSNGAQWRAVVVSSPRDGPAVLGSRCGSVASRASSKVKGYWNLHAKIALKLLSGSCLL